MFEIIKETSTIFSIPILLVIGWAVFSIWSKQEKLYKQQAQLLEEKYNLAKEEAERLKQNIDSPSELHAEVEIIKTSFKEQLKKLEIEKTKLVQILEEKNLENGDLISKLEENNDEIYLLMAHEIKQNTFTFRAVLNMLENLFKKQIPIENNQEIEIYSKAFGRAYRVIDNSLESLQFFNNLSKSKKRKT